MNRITRWALALATVTAPLALALPAGAATSACLSAGNGCAGIQSQQAVPLQLSTSGVPGSIVRATTPAFRRSQDWRIHPGNSNAVSRIEWYPRGVASHLCITATSDVLRAPVRLEPCQHGVAGVSHQRWRHVEHADGSYSYVNVADGLALAVAGDFPGAQVQVRSQHLGSPNQRFFCTTSAP